ncbi:MAG: IS66 family insertion sequence element accessory protein TnpB [Candidatus Obscuribacterales bacterium]|nr:IS66 family insertion sequence element accessory protein TnpB [Candidatus Obscuribacterales bacterium]
MLNPSPTSRVFICSTPVDMRKAIDGLSGMVRTHFGENPLNGQLFVFFGKRRDRIKLLFWDFDGFVLCCKRLEYGSFRWLQKLDLSVSCEIEPNDFAMLLASINQPSPRKMRGKNATTSSQNKPLHLV